MENSMESPQKIKNRTTIWFHNSTPGYIAKENKSTNQKRYMHLYIFIAALFTRVRIRKQPKCPSLDEWIKKTWEIYIYIYIYIWPKSSFGFFCAVLWKPERNFWPTQYNWILLSHKRMKSWEFPGGPAVRTLCFHCWGPWFNP